MAILEIFILIAYSCLSRQQLTRPVEAFSVLPTMQSYGHKIVKRHRGGRRACRGRKDDHLSIPDTEGYLTDWSCALGRRFPE